MFGYIVINKPELKVREYETYHSWYCGLCRTLGKRCGKACQLTLSFEMTFLSLLLSSLGEEETVTRRERCPIRPLKKFEKRSTSYTEYAADMNVLLAWYDLMDDWRDDKNLKSLAAARAITPQVRRIRLAYPRQAKAVTDYVRSLMRCEKSHVRDLDRASGLTGKMLAEIFVPEEDFWSPRLRRIGYYLGKYIYLMDAYEDLPSDLVSGAYNPWRYAPPSAQFDDDVLAVLTMTVSEAARTFEELPITDNAEILRNILYSGLWSRYSRIRETRVHDDTGSKDHRNGRDSSAGSESRSRK